MPTSFQCDNCGACCKTFPIFASEEDSIREPLIQIESCKVAEWHKEDDKAYQLFPLPFRDTCCFLRADNLCSVYETRPNVCRRFEAGSEQCNEARKRAGIKPLGLPELAA